MLHGQVMRVFVVREGAPVATRVQLFSGTPSAALLLREIRLLDPGISSIHVVCCM
jgi:hypothetical protein